MHFTPQRVGTLESEKGNANVERMLQSTLGSAHLDDPLAKSISHSSNPELVMFPRLTNTALVPYETSATYTVAKRSLDVFVASMALIALAPLLIAIALVIWLEDGGTIFYSQLRVGKDGRLFRFYKFRSMVPNADALKAQLAEMNEADGPIFKMKHDPRITRIGRVLRKYSLDELPQFWNVLQGQMSLVGPRPHLPSEVNRYQENQWVRLAVQPGLICLREVSGRSKLSFEQWVETDLLYVRNRSLLLDLKILLMAIPAVIKGEGAY
ncbi:MAG: hypothetical protein OHK0029_26030 [Armatimonadaceae bacterium]